MIPWQDKPMGLVKGVVRRGVFVALALSLQLLEGMLPVPLPIPGFKLGLANLVSVYLLLAADWRMAAWVVGGRVLLASLFGGTLLGPAFWLSTAGATLSLIGMNFVLRCWSVDVTIIGVSLIGAILHNLAQLVTASFLMQTTGVFALWPWLVSFALPTGFVTGWSARALWNRTRWIWT